MPALKTYDLFISHAWTHNAEYDRLVKRLRATPNFQAAGLLRPEAKPARRQQRRKAYSSIEATNPPCQLRADLGWHVCQPSQMDQEGNSYSSEPQQANRWKSSRGDSSALLPLCKKLPTSWSDGTLTPSYGLFVHMQSSDEQGVSTDAALEQYKLAVEMADTA